MKNYLHHLVLLLLTFSSWAQTATTEQFPVFPSCEGKSNQELATCFYSQVQQEIFSRFKVPENVQNLNYKGSFFVLFEVNNQGKFVLQYVNAPYPELNE